jgi:transcriptional regulator with XRE-family HTH domain
MSSDQVAATLGQEIMRLRMLAGITLRRFAELVEVSAAYVSDIEHDRRRPSDDVLRRMVKELKHVGATFDGFDKLNSRIDPDLQKWISNTPTVRQMLREVKKSGQDPLDVIRRLQENAPKTKRGVKE